MLNSRNIRWARQNYPYLPKRVLAELIEKLTEYSPKTPITTEKPTFDPKIESWCYPYFGTRDEMENFHYEDYEAWTELVENDLMKKHNLSHFHFES